MLLQQKELVGCFVVYRVAKSMNFVNVETLWPMIIAYELYRTYFNKITKTESEVSSAIVENTMNTSNNFVEKQKMYQEHTKCCQAMSVNGAEIYILI